MSAGELDLTFFVLAMGGRQSRDELTRGLGIHGCQNYATVSTVASATTHVPQPNAVFEMRTIILIKNDNKINGNIRYTTHQPT